MTELPHEIFISHSARDRDIASVVCAALEAGVARCWIAPRDILPGKDWGEAIVEAMNQSRVMVLLFSAHANESLEVRREVQHAFEKRVAVLPVRIEDVLPKKGLGYYLNSVQWLDALGPIEPHLPALSKQVSRMLRGLSATQDDSASAAAFQPPVAPAPVALAAGPLAYATPFPQRAGRRIAWLAIAAGASVIVVLSAITALRWHAARAASTAALLQSSAAANVPAIRTPPPPAVQGSRAVMDAINDFATLDRRLGTFNQGLKAGADESARSALLDLTRSSEPFLSCVNVFGASGGFVGTNDPIISDRVQALHAVGAEPASVRRFAEQLFAFAQAGRDLQPKLDDLAARRTLADLAGTMGLGSSTTPATQLATQSSTPEQLENESAQRQRDAVAQGMRSLAAAAYVSGLKLLGEVRPMLPLDVDGRLGNLQNLEPRQFPTDAALASLGASLPDDVAKAAATRQAAEADEEQRWGQMIDVWSARLMPPFKMSGRSFTELAGLFSADIREEFRITQADSPSTAASRAADTRRNGWDGAAIVDFFCYAARFADTNPAAEDYARAGVQYTLQRTRLGIPLEQGVLYYVSSSASGPAAKDALRTGDLVVTYAGKPVTDPEAFADSMRQVGATESVNIDFLRRDDRGRFNLQTARTEVGGLVSAVFMPI